MAESLINSYADTLAAPIGSGAAGCTVAGGVPAAMVGGSARLVLYQTIGGAAEFVRATFTTATAWVLERAVEDAARFPAAAWPAGTRVEQVLTAGGLAQASALTEDTPTSGLNGFVRADGSAVDALPLSTAIMAQPPGGDETVTTVWPSGGDDTAAIQAALDAGGAVRLAPGTFAVTGLTVAESNVTLEGSGVGVTTLANSHATNPTVRIRRVADGTERNENVTVRGLRFSPSVSRAAGVPEVHVGYAWNVVLEDLRFDGGLGPMPALSSGTLPDRGSLIGRCIQVGTTDDPGGDGYKFRTVFGRVRSVYAENVTEFLWIGNATDWWFSDFHSWSPRAGDDAKGITVETCVQSCNFSDFDVIGPCDTPGYAGTGRALYVQDTLAGTFIARNAYNSFHNGYLDSFHTGLDASNAEGYVFYDVWFSDRPGVGATLASTTRGFTFQGCRFFNSGSHGLFLDGPGHVAAGCQVHGNARSGIGDGVVLWSAAAGARVKDCSITDGTGYQLGAGASERYGVFIDATCPSFVVRDNYISGFGTPVNNEAGTSAVKIVADNI